MRPYRPPLSQEPEPQRVEPQADAEGQAARTDSALESMREMLANEGIFTIGTLQSGQSGAGVSILDTICSMCLLQPSHRYS